ncbi:DNA-3-methyladenine glycosylase I [Motiliproteus sp. MSK22-1]|uniref:DNA-3-methyladenine glycosylase I n=1 Tax=Motiliproteus sp. MSK22-1 TaxID=1897630 RepID=UPI0009761C36|nr:DNA-3-methyladenine glycosylase I [Motiliproteus sp. MSK22-1]OMH25925.1 3-methyladenine DNA glycosylase [Motiliproteus sp. MSK22-1]
MKDFKWISEHAYAHKGADFIESCLPEIKSADELLKVPDDRYLSDMSRRIFQAGLKHSLVDSKWPEFEKAFYGFDPEKICLMSDQQLENQMQNKLIIRHWAKIKSIRTNALMIRDIEKSQGSFASLIAAWPCTEIVDLWGLLKKQGAQLGGLSAASFLRMAGKDTFKLTPDVVAALMSQAIVDKTPTSKRDLQAVQNAFNQWHKESNRPFSHISMMLAFTVGW